MAWFSRCPAGTANALHLPRLLAGLLALGTVVALGVFASAAASAQPAQEWSAILGGQSDEFAHAVALSGDGGFVIAGETRSYGAGSQDAWMVKLDASGNEVWTRVYGGPESDIAYAVQRTSDGGYVLAGETHSFGGATASRSNFWIIKTDSTGRQEWQRSYDSSGGLNVSVPATSDAALAVRQTLDGGYILAGVATGPFGASIRLLRIGSRGEQLWSGDAGGPPGALAYDVAEIAGGGFIVAANSSSEESGSDALLIKTSSNGAQEWSATFGGKHNDEARSLALTSDGGYALGGFTWSQGAGLSDFWLVKANASGEEEWQRSFGGVPRDAAHSLIETADGGLALAGWSESFSGGDRFWIIKTGPSGGLQWSTAHPLIAAAAPLGLVSAGARAVRQTADGGFIVVGWTGSIRGARDILAVRLAPIRADSPAPAGNVVVLENTGSTSITLAAVGFDRVYSGQPLRFWREGRLIDRDNPLPVGESACTQPAPGLVSGARLTLDQMGSFEAVYLNTLAGNQATAPVSVDAGAYRLDLDGEVAGSFSVVSRSPCEGSARLLPEGPRAPSGISGVSSGAYPGSITLDWGDNSESDIFGYAVYASRSKHGPFVRQAWLLPESAYANTGRTDGSSYYYAVTAINSWGVESPKSEVVRVTSQDFTPPEPPSQLRVTSVDRKAGTAQLEWSGNAEADLSGYRVYRQDGEEPRSPVSALLFASKFEDRTLPIEGDFSYSVTAIDLDGNESENSSIAPPALDFFGKILEVRRNFVGTGSFSVNTKRGRVEVEVVSSTEIRAPNRPAADLGDLALGDEVAVSLDENAKGTVAWQVHLVPGKTRNRHLAGRVSRLTEREIVIQPPGESSKPVTFALSGSVPIRVHQELTDLAVGEFVVVSYMASSSKTAAALIEINVIPGREPGELPEHREGSYNVAVLRGTFQGINPDNANLILASTEVAIDANTVMTTGVSVGDSVVVEAILLSDGSLLARRVEPEESAGQVAARTVLRGSYQGRDAASRRWTVSGVKVLVDKRTYIDALPGLGQRVKVTALVQEDGTLHAREVENLMQTEDPDGEHPVELEGILREIVGRGSWNVGGVAVQVDANTVLSGHPSVGRRVAVSAMGSYGGLTATRVSAAPSGQHGPVRSVSIRGTVDRVEGSQVLIVNGLRVSLSDLTQTIGNVEAGASVRISAELHPAGELLARQVAESDGYDETGETQANPVDIEGRIERVRADGSLTVNGIPVAVSSLTVIDAALQVGVPVRVRGLLQRDGSVLAREVVSYGPGITGGTEASIAGIVERVKKDVDGRITGFVIDKISVTTDQLTRIELELTPSSAVIAQAIVIDGEILAVTVEPHPAGSIGALPLVQMQGTVEQTFPASAALPRNITVNGITVRITENTISAGPATNGAVVKITGSISGSVFLARKIESVPTYASQAGSALKKFNLSGIVEEITPDSEGRPETILLSGNLITIVPLTVLRKEVSVGDEAAAHGIVRDGALLAAFVGLEDTSAATVGSDRYSGK